MKKISNRGFSLVELLAVIVILGIFAGIAIAGVSRVIENSRKDAYLDIVIQHKQNIEKLINSDEYYVFDTNTVYYFDYRLGLDDPDKDDSSPFAKWINCYVVVTYDGKANHFYWVGIDKAGWRIDLKKEVSKLKKSDIYNSKNTYISTGNSIGGRDNITVYKYGEDAVETTASLDVTSEQAKQCFKFEQLSNGTYSITGYDISCGTEVEVPSKIDNKTVTVIGEQAFKGLGLTKVTLYNGITEIKIGAFQNNKITELKLSASIKTIGDWAFYGNKLTQLDLPEGVTSIKSWAFAYNSLTSVSFPKTLTSIGGYAFYGNKLTEIDLKSNVSLGGAAFSRNSMSASKGIIYKVTNGVTDYSTIIGYGGEDKDLVIPEMVNGVKVTTIASSAFASCGLTSVVIPDSVTYIGSSAFYDNYLKTISFPPNLKTIGSTAFRNNYLSSIDIPDSVTSIGSAAFVYNCLPSGSDIIYARTSSGIDYSTIVSGASGRNNGSSYCKGATTLTIPAVKNGVKLKTIQGNAFYCSYYSKITLPDLSQTNNLTIGNNAFYHNNVSDSSKWFYAITNGKYDYSTLSSYAGSRSGALVIPGEYNGVKLKKIYASFTWTSFTSIEIPESVEYISGGLFTKTNSCNTNLVKIINKTGREFDWYSLTGSTHTNPGKFATGTVSHQSGDIVITNK